MAAGVRGSTSNAGRIVAWIDAWPGVSTVRAECGVGVALVVGGNQIIHLHTGDEAELRLTRPVVERLGGALADSGRVMIRPGGEWIVVRLDTDSDLSLVMSLASVAIKANSGLPAGCAGPRAGCGSGGPRPPTRTTAGDAERLRPPSRCHGEA